MMWATGEHERAIAKRLECSLGLIDDILTGKRKIAGKNTVEFVRKIQAQEAKLADKLKDLDDGRIVIVYFKRKFGCAGFQWRSRVKRKNKSKSDREALAALGLSRQEFPGIAQKTYVVPSEPRTTGFGYLTDKLGRPKVDPSKPATTSRGVS